MNVASIELCKELYELSGWDDTVFDWLIDKTEDEYTRKPQIAYRSRSESEIFDCKPAYDLGYLLRKLPAKNGDMGEMGSNWLYMQKGMSTHWAGYHNNSGLRTTNQVDDKEANTPEDAACKLAIELFKRGILY